MPAKYAAETRRTSEFARHRVGNKFADRTMPHVLLAGGLEPEEEANATLIAEPRPLTPVMKIERHELPETYFQSEDANKDTWLEEIVQECMGLNASDLLLTTENGGYRLRASARIDGRVRPIRQVDGEKARNILGKFKAENGLSTGGSFAPQATIYQVPVGDALLKARVQAFRTAESGEAIAMRLPPTGKLRQLEELSFSDHNLQLFYDMLGTANRMILIAGPMGEGKTTTAHAALKHVDTGVRTIWTVEDPVERVLPGTIQLEVDERNGAGYDALLPALVRSDYDTLFLGEIRDQATAAAGVRQAKAGRQVITTIHANNNITALLRLIDLSEDSPLSVLDSVRGIVSQRLVGRLNKDWNGKSPIDKYSGRVPVHEVLTITDDLTEAIMANAPLSLLRGIAAHESESTFSTELARLISEGVTDEEEAKRVLGG